jgi:DNA repair photolyase
MTTPSMLASNEDALSALLSHPHFVAGQTPIQIFNRATDPFLANVKPHLFWILQALDNQHLTNMVLLITRYKVTEEDMVFLESLRHIRVTLFFTYSGGAQRKIEPIDPKITRDSIITAGRFRKRTRTILYWRPLVVGWNDDDDTMRHVLRLAENVDAIVFSGLFYRDQVAAHFEEEGITQPYQLAQRRKVLPRELEQKVLRLYRESGAKTPLFRKSTCGAAYTHGLPDPNGHWGVQEICDICPAKQKEICAAAHQAPGAEQFQALLDACEYHVPFEIADGHIWVENLSEQERYNLQHQTGYQIWNRTYPHLPYQHGRAPLGWDDED